jgi:hypothetical protein
VGSQSSEARRPLGKLGGEGVELTFFAMVMFLLVSMLLLCAPLFSASAQFVAAAACAGCSPHCSLREGGLGWGTGLFDRQVLRDAAASIMLPLSPPDASVSHLQHTPGALYLLELTTLSLLCLRTLAARLLKMLSESRRLSLLLVMPYASSTKSVED